MKNMIIIRKDGKEGPIQPSIKIIKKENNKNTRQTKEKRIRTSKKKSASVNNPNNTGLDKFRNIHKNKSILICGAGSSINDIPKDEYEKCLTIGVNDIGRLFTPTYMYFVDKLQGVQKKSFDKENNRAKYIIESEAEAIFLHYYSSNIHMFNKKKHNKIYKAQAINFNQISKINNKYDFNNLYYSCHSPFPAVTLAIYMGATEIGIIGVDFYGPHYFSNEKTHPILKMLNRANMHFARLESFFDGKQNRKINFYNLSKLSKITAFEKKDPDKFIKNFYKK